MVSYQWLGLATLRRAGYGYRDLFWENLALRQQLEVYQRQARGPRLEPLVRVVVSAPRPVPLRRARGRKESGSWAGTGQRAVQPSDPSAYTRKP